MTTSRIGQPQMLRLPTMFGEPDEIDDEEASVGQMPGFKVMHPAVQEKEKEEDEGDYTRENKDGTVHDYNDLTKSIPKGVHPQAKEQYLSRK